MSSFSDRLRQLDEIEQNISKVIQAAGQAINELSKDQPSEELIISKATDFIKKLEDVERNLTSHIQYLSQVSTNQQHEGSIYAAEKDFELACHRTDVIRSKLEATLKKLNKLQLDQV